MEYCLQMQYSPAEGLLGLLTCRRFTGECSWEIPLKEVRKVGGAEKLSCVVLTAKASADPTGCSGAGMALQNRPKLR